MPTPHADRLPRYQRLRQVGLPLNNRLVKTLSKRDIEEGGKKLGLLRNGTLVFETEDETSVLMDYCIHDVRRKGMNAVERFLAGSPAAAGPDELVLLEALRQAWFSLFAVAEAEAGVGVQVRDLLRGDALFLVDVALSQSCGPGRLLATRVMAPQGIGMTTGAPLPLAELWPAQQEVLVAGLKAQFPGADFRRLSPDQASEFSATVIRGCLQQGAAGRVSYVGVGETAPSGRLPVSPAGPNDPCPCGSGRKFKHCCGATGDAGQD
jgi:hypothetical protein